jgi:hypothetical protein
MAENGRMKDKRTKPSHRSPGSTIENAMHQHLLLMVMTLLLLE